jgi:hypothetical protein
MTKDYAALSTPEHHLEQIAAANAYRPPEFGHEGVAQHVSNALAEIWQELADMSADVEERIGKLEKKIVTPAPPPPAAVTPVVVPVSGKV